MDREEFAYLKNAVLKKWVEGKEFILPIQRLVDFYLGRTKSERPMENLSTYLRTVVDYCKFVRKDPETILREAFDDLNKGYEQRDPTLRYMTDYFKHVKKIRKENTAISRMAHLRTFYKANKFTNFTFIIPKMAKGKEKQRMDKALAYEVWVFAKSLRDKALVHILWSTGLSVIDVVKLEVKQIEEYENWGYVEVRRTKTKRDYIAIFPPDCMKSIKKYLGKRRSESKWLFPSNGEKRLSTSAVQQILRRLGKDMGLYEKGRNPIHAHNFRKGHNSELKLSKIDSEFVEFLQGRELGTRSSYATYTPEQVIEYLKPHYEALILTGVTSNNRVDELEQELTYLKERVEQLSLIVEQVRPILREQGLVLATRRPKGKKKSAPKKKKAGK